MSRNRFLYAVIPLLAVFTLLTCRPARAASPSHKAAAPSMASIQVFVPESLTTITEECGPMSGANRSATMTSVVSTTGLKVALVGKVEGGEGLTFEVVNNSRSRVTPVVYDGYFHAQVTLSLGVNTIEVRWRKGDSAWSGTTLSVFRASKTEGGVSGNYPAYVFHLPEKEEHCQQCHRMGLTSEEIETGMEKNCLKCHKGLGDNLHVHGPVGVGICSVCHDPNSVPNKYKIEENDNVLCYGCHTQRKEIDESKKLMHGPVGAGICTACHDPHGSPFEFQLVKAKTELCAMCHEEDVKRWTAQAYLHPPFKAGNCVGCHDPHSSDYKYNLKRPRADVCMLCHTIPIPGHLHDIGLRPQFQLPDDCPLNDDGTTMCLTCHDPHGARGVHVTRRDGCDGCHPK